MLQNHSKILSLRIGGFRRNFGVIAESKINLGVNKYFLFHHLTEIFFIIQKKDYSAPKLQNPRKFKVSSFLARNSFGIKETEDFPNQSNYPNLPQSLKSQKM